MDRWISVTIAVLAVYILHRNSLSQIKKQNGVIIFLLTIVVGTIIGPMAMIIGLIASPKLLVINPIITNLILITISGLACSLTIQNIKEKGIAYKTILWIKKL